MKNFFDFTGKRILVTGASSGIGRSTAIRLSEQGAQIVALGRNIERLEETKQSMHGENHRIFSVDFSEAVDLSSLFSDIMEDGIKLNGLVHCAGIATILPLNMIKKDKFDECMNVNFYSFIELVRQFARKKNRTEASAVVGISAFAAQYPIKCQTMYAASKAAMNASVRALAFELADKNIRINTVMPAVTNTKMVTESIESSTGSQIEERLNAQLLGITQPEDIADVIMFLLSDASKSITGRSVYADGGLLK